jgi:hypothetical protein
MTDQATARSAALDAIANCHELLKGDPSDHMVSAICNAQAEAGLALAMLDVADALRASIAGCAWPSPTCSARVQTR